MFRSLVAVVSLRFVCFHDAEGKIFKPTFAARLSAKLKNVSASVEYSQSSFNNANSNQVLAKFSSYSVNANVCVLFGLFEMRFDMTVLPLWHQEAFTVMLTRPVFAYQLVFHRRR